MEPTQYRVLLCGTLDAIKSLSTVDDGDFETFNTTIVNLSTTLVVAANSDVSTDYAERCGILIDVIAQANRDLCYCIQEESTYSKTDVMDDLSQALAAVARLNIVLAKPEVVLCLPAGIN